MDRFTDACVILTGAASGIGAATARRFAREGARLVLADRNETALDALVAELGERGAVVGLSGDVAEPDHLAGLVRLAHDRFDRLDILVNNAGIGSLGTAPELSPADWQRVLDVDLSSVFYGCRAAIPLMRESGGGAIVNTASVSGLGGDYGFGAYNAAKGAVVNYTRALAIDHAGEGIRVNAVCPGLIETPLSAGLFSLDGFVEQAEASIPMGRAGTADEVAAAITFLASSEASYITGATLVIDGGVTATTGQVNFPRIIGAALAKRSTGENH